jgi:hypothetical protein
LKVLCYESQDPNSTSFEEDFNNRNKAESSKLSFEFLSSKTWILQFETELQEQGGSLNPKLESLNSQTWNLNLETELQEQKGRKTQEKAQEGERKGRKQQVGSPLKPKYQNPTP